MILSSLYHIPNQMDWMPELLTLVNSCNVRIIDFHLFAGVYKKEEAHLLLKAFQIKGPVDIFVSKFENDNWGLDGYVSTLWGLSQSTDFLVLAVCTEAGAAEEVSFWEELCCVCPWKTAVPLHNSLAILLLHFIVKKPHLWKEK